MNNLNIGNKILLLRKEKSITQEQLANMVGISAGAVCKWETGNTVPDISLLAPLARAFGVTIDELLSFTLDLTEEEVRNIKKELIPVFIQSGYEAGEEKCKEYLKEYPNSIYLKLVIASLYQMYSMVSAAESEEIYKTRLQNALELLAIVAASNEAKYISSALFIIASIHMMMENYEESEKVLKSLVDSRHEDPMTIYPFVLQRQGKTKEAKVLCEQILLSQLNQISALISTLAKIAVSEEDYDKAFLLYNTMCKIQSIFNVGLHAGEYNLCRLYIITKQPELAAKYFKTYVEGLLATGYNYSRNDFFQDIELEVADEGQKSLRMKMYQSHMIDPELKVLEGLEDYEDAVRMLKDQLES